MEVPSTYGQLHFLDLGWERFESLILGIVFKWRRCENIKHVEVARSDGGIVEILDTDRTCTYHFQCKRYEKLKNSDINKILNDYCDKNVIRADKYILVTACSLIASNLNTLRTHTELKGFNSVEAWTKSELEAMLFAQYYGLLYIFFEVSVVKQRINRISTVRRNISLKCKMNNDFLLNVKG